MTGGALIALLAAAMALASSIPAAAPTPTALPAPTDPPASSTPVQAQTAEPSPTPAPALAAPGLAASHTPTFAPPPSASPSPIVSADAPPPTAVLATRTGPGVSQTFDLPQGLYRVIFHADAGFDLVLPVVEQGDCGSEPLFDSGSGSYDGSATYESSGCRLHFEVDGAGGGWSIAIAPLTDAAPRSLPLSMSGSTPATSDVLDLPKGTYRVAAENRGTSLVVTPLVLDGECLERPILVASAPGSYQTTYDSAGCKVIFQVSLTGGPWTLTVTAAP